MIRSMRAQLHSTRLFNENYFVLLAALDDLAARGVKLVALPGDFSDDGQPMHVRGLTKVLKRYQREHGMRFFAIPGNHDPVRPFTTDAGKDDFLAADGHELAVFSKGDKKCTDGDSKYLICSDDLKKWGYAEIVAAMADFGFFPRDDDLYFETPFSRENGGKFDFAHRQLTWCAKKRAGNCIQMPETSYLVEPVNGVWLLAIDANVYVPKDPNRLSTDGDSYSGSSNAGYNAMLQSKPMVIDWISDVVARAKRQNKQLIAFSHFPMADFYDMAGDDIEQLFGKGKQQMRRMPLMDTAKALANTGLQIHVGGHMHINDTGTVTADDGSVLFNIQAPTLAAYRPAYKLLTLISAEQIAVETVILDEVPRFNELFPHYRQELSYLKQHQPGDVWQKKVLNVGSYGELTDAHLTELVRLRYLPDEWPKQLVALLAANSVADLFHKSLMCHETPNIKSVDIQGWPSETPGSELINDFYRLRNADSIALVSEERKSVYQTLASGFQGCSKTDKNLEQLALMLTIMTKFIQAQPSDHLLLDLRTGHIR